MRNMFNKLWRGLLNRPDCTIVLIVPSYDRETIKLHEWTRFWKLKGAVDFRAERASHENIVSIIDSSDERIKLLFFIGHGLPAELLTGPHIGKSVVVPDNQNHGCLLHVDDMAQGRGKLHIVAWACFSAQQFGAKVADLPDSAFLGFERGVSLVINHDQSEKLWNGLLNELFERVSTSGVIADGDAQWLRGRMLDIRDRIKSGELNLGKYRRANTMFLKWNAGSIQAHRSTGL